VVEVDLPERAEWMMSHRGVKVRVGKKKQEAYYECDIWGNPRMAMHHIPGRDHHRYYRRCQPHTSSYVLPLKLRG